MRRSLLAGLGVVLLLAVVALASSPALRHELKLLAGLEARPQITPLAVGALPTAGAPSATAGLAQLPTVAAPSATPPVGPPTPPPSAAGAPSRPRQDQSEAPWPEPAERVEGHAADPTPAPPPAPIVVNGRSYDAYIPAAVKEGQAYQYSCEFDAAWVILQTFGFDVTVDEIIARAPIDASVEPSYAETAEGFVITGGDIRRGFSGDYRGSFLARSTGSAMAPLFAAYGLRAEPVRDRAGVEAALRAGALVWMKTTVDFKPWRPAVWVTPDGGRIKTVLGNDHAVVVIGFDADVVVIRDVLGPTSTNRQRPLEYEVAWETFLWAWGAQGFDGLAVAPAAGLGW